MQKLYRLNNTIKHYNWGSAALLPGFLGSPNKENLPWAEMWMGTHSAGPSMCEEKPLADVAGGELPFLFKLLAVEKPLSIQAHPNKAQAQEGFMRENEAGLSLDDRRRNYRDANHKPEILCAITPFTVMAGFREPEKIRAFFECFISAVPALGEILSPLLRAIENTLHDFFRSLFLLSKNDCEKTISLLSEKASCDGKCDVSPEQWNLMKALAAQYPQDAAVLSPFYLNLFTLQPLQAIFIPAGVLHGYVSGFGAELMASSDNVLRGGLTSKHVDSDELMNILDFKPFMPDIVTPPVSQAQFSYPCPCDDFSLTALHGNGSEISLPVNSPAICVVTEGEISACSAVFKKGESFFISETNKGESVKFNGCFSAFIAAGQEPNENSG
jgi:mannose-6-phosphate isomerase